MATVNITPDSSIKEIRQAMAEAELELDYLKLIGPRKRKTGQIPSKLASSITLTRWEALDIRDRLCLYHTEVKRELKETIEAQPIMGSDYMKKHNKSMAEFHYNKAKRIEVLIELVRDKLGEELIEDNWADYVEVDGKYVHKDCTVINKETGGLEIDHIKLTGGEA